MPHFTLYCWDKHHGQEQLRLGMHSPPLMEAETETQGKSWKQKPWRDTVHRLSPSLTVRRLAPSSTIKRRKQLRALVQHGFSIPFNQCSVVRGSSGGPPGVMAEAWVFWELSGLLNSLNNSKRALSHTALEFLFSNLWLLEELSTYVGNWGRTVPGAPFLGSL